MKLYKCNACKCGFAILTVKRGPNNKGGKGVCCPLCKGEVEEVDAVAEAGASLAKKALEWWRSLPSGE